MARTELDIDEKTYGVITCTLQDEDGDAVAASVIDSIEMTLIDVYSGDVIDDRQKQNVKNANDCTIHDTSGLFTWNVQVEDTTIQNSNLPIGQREPHLATITVTWDTTKQMHFEILLNVLNLRSVPQVSA